MSSGSSASFIWLAFIFFHGVVYTGNDVPGDEGCDSAFEPEIHSLSFLQGHIGLQSSLDSQTRPAAGHSTLHSSFVAAINNAVQGAAQDSTKDLEAVLIVWLVLLFVGVGMSSYVLRHVKEQRQAPAGSYSWALLWVRLVTAVASFSEGYGFGCMYGAHDGFTTDLHLSLTESALVVSVVQFAIAAGCPFGGILADRVGRVPTLAVGFVLIIVGSLIMAFAGGFTSLFSGRVIGSLGMGFGMGAVTAYMAEASPSAHRGALVGLEEFLLSAGILAAYLVNTCFAGVPHGWRIMLGFSGVVPAVILLSFLVNWPLESPRFLLMQGRTAEAEEVLHELLDENEAKQLLSVWATESKDSDAVSQVSWFTFFAGAGSMATQSLAGINVATVYVDGLTASKLPYISLVVGLTRLVVVGTALRFIDVVSRRRMLQVSIAGVAVSCFACACFFWASLSVVWRFLGLSVYFVFYELGVGPATWVYVGEVFDSPVRGRGTSASVTVGRVLGGLFLVAFPYGEETVGLGGSWCFLGLSSLCAWAFVGLVLPETKGVPLEDIGKLLQGDAEDGTRAKLPGSTEASFKT